MSFKEIISFGGYNKCKESSIRISISKVSENENGNLSSHMIIIIGKNICDHIGINDGDIIKFFQNESDEKNFLIKKSDDGIGYKTSKYPNRISGNSMKIQIRIKTFNNIDNIELYKGLFPVNHEFFDDGVLFYM